MQVRRLTSSRRDELVQTLTNFARWLDNYGESSWDFQSFYAGPIGGRAKSLYYRRPIIGTAAVAPMVFFEALFPAARRLFYHRMRFPIADAHYAMGFAMVYQTTGNSAWRDRAIHFLRVLKQTRCRRFKEYCWGYPFDWVWRGGVIKKETPLITTTPYVYEAFLQFYELVQSDRSAADSVTPEELDEWRQILASIARHASFDIKDFRTSEKGSNCSYTPSGGGGVINAAAYRAFLLTSASKLFANEEYWVKAERNVNFVLENQNPDGSWPYAKDGVRDFVDHYHTCFVMKALAKIYFLTGYTGCADALAKGVEYYRKNLLDCDGLPRPFSKAPRLTVYKRELYDLAECINFALLLRNMFPELQSTLHVVVDAVLNDWLKPDGSFHSRRLYWRWDDVPMHRWGQSQMFRALACYVCEASDTGDQRTARTTANAIEREEQSTLAPARNPQAFATQEQRVENRRESL